MIYYSQSKECVEKEKANSGSEVTACGIPVQLVFAAETNGAIPDIVGQILKGAYLQRQSI